MAPRIAVLGCGYWGGNHIRTLKSLGALQAVSDSRAEQAERLATEFNVPSIPV
ncbi:MAG TPA: gfo/Idh/MocA family oxidoreductase, partial [Ochrobactrum anthropi]|nr:gfo/Idh/MocA family oxidoreductase [Brucella anthropi]